MLAGDAANTVSRTGQTAMSFGDIWVLENPSTAILRMSLRMLQTARLSCRKRAGFISECCGCCSCCEPMEAESDDRTTNCGECVCASVCVCA